MWNVTWWTKRGPTNYFWKFRQPNHWRVTLLPAGCQIKTDKDFVPLLIRPSTGSHLKFPTVLKLHYDSFFSGRCDIQETLDRIWELYFCPKMTVILSDYVKSCSKCQARKLGRPTKQNITAFPTLANHLMYGSWASMGNSQLRHLGNPTYLLLLTCFQNFCTLCQLQTLMHSLLVLLFFILYIHVCTFGVRSTSI